MPPKTSISNPCRRRIVIVALHPLRQLPSDCGAEKPARFVVVIGRRGVVPFSALDERGGGFHRWVPLNQSSILVRFSLINQYRHGWKAPGSKYIRQDQADPLVVEIRTPNLGSRMVSYHETPGLLTSLSGKQNRTPRSPRCEGYKMVFLQTIK